MMCASRSTRKIDCVRATNRHDVEKYLFCSRPTIAKIKIHEKNKIAHKVLRTRCSGKHCPWLAASRKYETVEIETNRNSKLISVAKKDKKKNIKQKLAMFVKSFPLMIVAFGARVHCPITTRWAYVIAMVSVYSLFRMWCAKCFTTDRTIIKNSLCKFLINVRQSERNSLCWRLFIYFEKARCVFGAVIVTEVQFGHWRLQTVDTSPNKCRATASIDQRSTSNKKKRQKKTERAIHESSGRHRLDSTSTDFEHGAARTWVLCSSPRFTILNF